MAGQLRVVAVLQENCVGVLTHIEEQESLQLDPTASTIFHFGKWYFFIIPGSWLLYSLCIFFNKRPSSLAPRAFGHAGWIMQKLLCRILPA